MSMEYAQKLFNETNDQNELNLLCSLYNHLNKSESEEKDKIFYIQAIILFAKNKQKLFNKLRTHFYSNISWYVRNSDLFIKWILNTKLNSEEWLFLIGNNLIILESCLHHKLFQDIKDENNLPNFLSQIRKITWFQHYNQFIQFIISNQILNLNEQSGFVISNIHDFKITSIGICEIHKDVMGYKILYSSIKEVLIAQVLIPAKSIILVPECENKLRCNHYIIQKIWNKKGEEQKSGFGPIYKKFYEVNMDVEVFDLDTNVSEICTTGLHFYSSFDEAVKSEYV